MSLIIYNTSPFMRIVYNITVLIDHKVHDQWKDWMTSQHIPQVMDTQCFESWRMSRILGADESQGINYAIQYIAPSMEVFIQYRDQHSLKLQQDHKESYGEHYVAFRTLMEAIDEG